MIREIIHAIGNLFTWFVIIAPWEQGIRVRLGKHVKLLEKGVYLRLPLIDKTYRQSVRRRLGVLRAQTITTTDGKCITLSGSVGYRIVNMLLLYETLHDAADTIEAEVATKISAFIASHSLDKCLPPEIEKHVRSALDLEQYGLGDAEFFVTSFVCARTYRFITGELPQWSRGQELSTTDDDRTVL